MAHVSLTINLSIPPNLALDNEEVIRRAIMTGVRAHNERDRIQDKAVKIALFHDHESVADMKIEVDDMIELYDYDQDDFREATVW